MPDKPLPVYRVRISGPQSLVRLLLTEYPLEPQSVHIEGDRVSMDLYVPDALIKVIREFKLTTESSYDASAQARKLLEKASEVNRFIDSPLPSGLGKLLK